MNQNNILNVKLSNSQLNKLKPRIKNGTEVTLNLSLNMVCNSGDETNFLHKLSLTNTQISRIGKAFGNGSSANIKLLQTHLSKMIPLRDSKSFPIAAFLFNPIGVILQNINEFKTDANKQ